MASSKRKSSLDGDLTSNSKRKSSPEVTCPKINSAYKEINFITTFGDVFKSKTSSLPDETLDCTVSNEPFKFCCLPNFLDSEDFLKRLKTELLDCDFVDKNNDLYKFQQSDELRNINLPHVKAIQKTFETEILDWIKKFTGIPLESTLDLTASQYKCTDVLLCHDDELEGRRIAFILYLVPDWCKKDGGTLDLFPQEKIGHPSPKSVHSIVPKWNSFVFFEVTQESFHQVSEIVNEDKCRLSLSGWFHGASVKRLPRAPYAIDRFERPLRLDSDELVKWINPSYFDLKTQLQIRTKFEDDCEIELTNFLIKSVYQEICCELEESELSWNLLSPPNKRRYEIANEETIPHTLNNCLKLFRSDVFFLFLSSITGLDLHPLAGSDHEDGAGGSESNVRDGTNATCCLQLNRWKHEFYTLICDQQETECGLDLRLFLNCEGWNQEFGGFVSYLAKDEDEELLTISPAGNSLALVFRDVETISFVKYINHQIKEMNPKGEFYCINAVYKE
uniref:Prolyl 4-hydroxylase alpha subunit domain-containing protein n=1 Tax=Strigamia maritima TaxID=126957 RepID=T1JIB2_STRMM